MAIDEAAFNEALADFVGVLDDTLETIQSKLDSLGTPTDFTEELATLDAAKQRLNEFVASNTGTAGGGTDETTPPEEVPPGEGGAGVGTGG